MSDKKLPAILIVDDSATTRAMIKRVIGMIDLPIGELYEAADGAAALARLESSRVDLVLADLNMPVMDGFEMIARMRRSDNWRTIPIVVISAQPDPEQTQQLKRDGVAGYLPKPFTPEDVRNMIGPLLEAAGKTISTQPQANAFNMILAEALAEAMETMAFMSPELIAQKDLPSKPADYQLVKVAFNGHDTHGSLMLAATHEFGAAIAANLNATHAASGEDALKELTNVTCGLLLRMRPGGGAGFHLSPPEISPRPQSNPAAIFHSSDVIALQVDGHLIIAQVVTDSAFYGS